MKKNNTAVHILEIFIHNHEIDTQKQLFLAELAAFYLALNVKSLFISEQAFLFGATHEARTRDLNLGKVALYQLS